MKVIFILYCILLTEKCYHVANTHTSFKTVFLGVKGHADLQQMLPFMLVEDVALMLVSTNRPGWWLLKARVAKATS